MPFIGLGAIALAMSLNLSHAADGYGLLKNSLALQVLAQSSSSGGSSSGGGTSTGGGSSSDDWDGWEKGRKFGYTTVKTDDYVIINSGFPWFEDEKKYIYKDCEDCLPSDPKDACDYGALKAC